jgi:hypothetical protein
VSFNEEVLVEVKQYTPPSPIDEDSSSIHAEVRHLAAPLSTDRSNTPPFVFAELRQFVQSKPSAATSNAAPFSFAGVMKFAQDVEGAGPLKKSLQPWMQTGEQIHQLQRQTLDRLDAFFDILVGAEVLGGDGESESKEAMAHFKGKKIHKEERQARQNMRRLARNHNRISQLFLECLPCGALY